MATLGEFGSLLQLGFGIGAGLSVFRTPILTRANRLDKILNREVEVLRGLPYKKAQDKQGLLATLRLDFEAERRKLDRLQLPFILAALAGAIINLIGLICASINAQHQPHPSWQIALVFFSTIYYLIIYTMVFLLSLSILDKIETRLKLLNQM